MDETTDYANSIADERHELHQDHQSSRPLSVGYERVGIAGEMAFSHFSGLAADLSARPGGDNGYDFILPLLFSVDVKTARKAGNLIQEQGAAFADIVVLAEFDDNTGKALLVGWEWGSVLKAAPVKDFGYKILNHHIPRSKLRTMDSLCERMMSLRCSVSKASER